jgi:hypothetical protein
VKLARSYREAKIPIFEKAYEVCYHLLTLELPIGVMTHLRTPADDERIIDICVLKLILYHRMNILLVW